MDEKVAFVTEWMQEQCSFAELCRSFNISRTLGYRYRRRYLTDGYAGLELLSKAPRVVWNRTPATIEQAIVQLRKSKPRYGALKILKLLEAQFDPGLLPAVSTTDLILKRNGLVKKRKRVHRIVPVHPVFHSSKPNQIWSADFKGEFRMGNSRYCYPLTIVDSYSRYILAVQGMYAASFERTKAVFEAVFREYGLPQQIHTDNGQPFGSAVSLSRLTRLAVWFIELGILPVYSDPGHPEQNGRHERMHEELKAETARAPGYDLGPQQRKFNAFRHEYNEVRPHQALGQSTPQQVYYRSATEYPDRIEPWEYPEGMLVKYVCRNGAIRWGGNQWITVSTTLIERHIGMEQFADGMWRVYYRNKLIGYLDEKKLRIQDDKGRLRRNTRKV